ncbi:MAG: phospholipase D-like domain-containing protein [Spirochaetota bacterium]
MCISVELIIVIVLLLMIPLSSVYFCGSFRRIGKLNVIGVAADSASFSSTVASFSDSQRTEGIAPRFWTDIDAIQNARLEAIRRARRLIQFETFIMTPGQRADAFAEALRERAAAGVKVQLLADNYGTRLLPDEYWESLEDAGVEVRFFSCFTWRAPLDYLRRSHRKLLIVDQEMAMIGGAGISDRWDGSQQAEPQEPWFDFEVEWRGHTVGMLTGYFRQHWSSVGGTVDLNEHEPDMTGVDDSHQILITSGDDPTVRNSSIRRLFQSALLGAQKRLWMASPYLLPDEETVDLLTGIRRAGVEVRILTMGPRSDKASVYYLSRERYSRLLQEGMQLYEYQPSMMHAKVILIDDQWVSLGSANLDPRSFYRNDELNLCSGDPSLVRNVEEMLHDGFQRSRLIRIDDWRKRPLMQRIRGQLASLFYWQM